MKTTDEIKTEVRQAIAEQLGLKLESVTDEAKIVDDLGADSLDAVEITMQIEDQFGIEIKDSDIDELTTVAKLVEYVEERLKR